MRTALDAPRDTLDADESNFVGKIRDHGWFATHVTGEEGHPGFTYSTGFWVTLQVPEVIVFSLKSDIAHDVLWDMFRDAKAGARWPMGTSVPDIFGNTDAYLFPVAKAHYPEHLGWSRWFYGGDDFPCVQLVWPDRSALFPWQAGFDVRFSADQPDLSEKGWLSSLSQ